MEGPVCNGVGSKRRAGVCCGGHRSNIKKFKSNSTKVYVKDVSWKMIGNRKRMKIIQVFINNMKVKYLMVYP